MTRVAIFFSTFALLVSVAFAHHGWGSYDANKPLTVTGPSGSLGTVDAPPAPGAPWLPRSRRASTGRGWSSRSSRSARTRPSAWPRACGPGANPYDRPPPLRPGAGLDRYFFLVRLTNHPKGASA